MHQMRQFMALDIETVPQKEYSALAANVRKWIDRRLLRINENKDEEQAWDYPKFASLDWDLGRILCISLGLYEEETHSIRLKSVIDSDERTVLKGFNELIRDFKGDYLHYNGLSFDIPFILNRMSVHGIDVSDQKITKLARYRTSPHYDLMQVRANWDYLRTKPLNILAEIAEVPDPKEEMDGAMVYESYRNGNLSEIQRYCEFDTATVANLYLSLVEGKPVVPLENYRFSE